MDIKTEQEIARIFSEIAGQTVMQAVAKILAEVEEKIKESVGDSGTEVKLFKDNGSKNILSENMNAVLTNLDKEEAFDIWKRNIKDISFSCDFRTNFPVTPAVQGFSSVPGRPISLPPLPFDNSDYEIMGTHTITISLGFVSYSYSWGQL